MKLSQVQTFVIVLVLIVAALVLFLTGHSEPAALALGAAIGALTPTDPTGVRES